MSKAYIGVKNFALHEMKGLLVYSTKHPDRLTLRQKITRLYRYPSLTQREPARLLRKPPLLGRLPLQRLPEEG